MLLLTMGFNSPGEILKFVLHEKPASLHHKVG